MSFGEYKNMLAYVFGYLLLHNKLLQNLAMEAINTYLTVSVAQKFRSHFAGWFFSSGSVTRLRIKAGAAVPSRFS